MEPVIEKLRAELALVEQLSLTTSLVHLTIFDVDDVLWALAQFHTENANLSTVISASNSSWISRSNALSVVSKKSHVPNCIRNGNLLNQIAENTTEAIHKEPSRLSLSFVLPDA